VQWKVRKLPPKVLTSFADQFFAQAACLQQFETHLLLSTSKKKWQKSISTECGFGRFPKVPELLGRPE
jgi:hypothetical protein